MEPTGGTWDWNDFYVRLTGTHLARLDAMGIGFHLFAPEIKYDHGVISAASLPHATIRYTADDTDPTAGSPRYTAPIRDTLPERYRFRAFYGNAHSPVGTACRHFRYSAACQQPAYADLPAESLYRPKRHLVPDRYARATRKPSSTGSM